MKTMPIAMAVAVTLGIASANVIALLAPTNALAQVEITRSELGAGTPYSVGSEKADRWSNDIYHTPQYMPGYPTAGVIYPRVVDVECKRSADNIVCSGYDWAPELGRGEYLLFRPVIKAQPQPQVVEKLVPVPVTVIKEVPIKKGKE